MPGRGILSTLHDSKFLVPPALIPAFSSVILWTWLSHFRSKLAVLSPHHHKESGLQVLIILRELLSWLGQMVRVVFLNCVFTVSHLRIPCLLISQTPLPSWPAGSLWYRLGDLEQMANLLGRRFKYDFLLLSSVFRVWGFFFFSFLVANLSSDTGQNKTLACSSPNFVPLWKVFSQPEHGL